MRLFPTPFYSLTAILLLLCAHVVVYGQGEADNWYIGPANGINFSSGSPVIRPGFTASPYDAGSASISDKNGRLLFYTNGETVWNRNNQPMPNGQNMMGRGSWQMLIVKQPSSSSRYYIFYFHSSHINLYYRLYYSVVDIRADNGLGDVTGGKDILLKDSVHIKITSTLHSNGTDSWITVHSTFGNTFFSFLLSSAGLDTHPVVSQCGQSFPPPWGSGEFGFLRSSPDGKKIALVNQFDFSNPAYTAADASSLELFSFDNSTAQFSNPIYIYGFLGFGDGLNGAEFSPSSRYLYIDKQGDDTNFLYQYDLCNFTQQVVANSQQIVGSQKTIVAPYDDYAFYQMQLAPDQKIYMINYPRSILSVIEKPDNPGLACGYQHIGFNTGNGSNGYTIPTFSNSIMHSIGQGRFNVQNTCLGETTSFSLIDDQVDSVKWDFGDPGSGNTNFSSRTNPTHLYAYPGQYLVKAIIYTSCMPDTLTKELRIFASNSPLLGNDTTLCTGEQLLLSPDAGDAGFLWQDGSTDDQYLVTKPGSYQVSIQLPGCTVKDTLNVYYKSSPVVSLGDDTTLCNGNTLLLDAQNPGASYLWNDGSSGSTLTVDSSGNYWVQVTKNGCSASDSIRCNFNKVPLVHLGNDTSLCSGNQLILHTTDRNATYVWQDHSSADSLIVRQPGEYSVVALENGCSSEDSIKINFRPLPTIFLGNDTTICKGSNLLLNAGNPGASYLWNDGSSDSTLSVGSSGDYWVRVTQNECSASDSINCNFTSVPVIHLGNDTSLCSGNQLILRTMDSNAVYEWQDHSTSDSLVVRQPGEYWVRATKNGCSSEDSLHVDFRPLPAIFLGDDTTVCEGSGLLLNAGNPGATYQWQDGSMDPSYLVDAGGTYFVTVNENSCESSDTIRVTYQLKPYLDLPSEQSICLGDTIILSPGSSIAHYNWQDGSSLPYYVVTQPGLYRVSAENRCGTAVSQTDIKPGICQLYIPTAFSPNSDGKNDYFRVKYSDRLSDFRLVIFNRWGVTVFETADPSNGWDGKWEGMDQPTGGYVWELSYKNDQTRKVVHASGTLTLIR